MNRERLDHWCRQGMRVVVTLILGVTILGWGGENPTIWGITECLGGGLALLWAARLGIGIKARFLWPPVTWVVLALMAYATARYGWLVHREGVEYLARRELAEVWVAGLVFLTVMNHLYHQEYSLGLTGAAIVLATLTVSLGTWQFFNGAEMVWGVAKPIQYAGRVSGTFLSPNHLGALVALLLPAALAGLLLADFRPVIKVCVGYATWVLAVGLALSLSRGAWIGSAISLTIFFAIVLRNHRRRITGLIVVGLGLFAAGAFMLKHGSVAQRLIDIVPRADYKDSRLRAWPTVGKMARERLLIGWGPAQSAVRYPAYRPAAREVPDSPTAVRSDYLETLVDYGIPGLVLLLAGAGCLLGEVLLRRRYFYDTSDDLTVRNSNRGAIALGASLGLLALMIHGVVESNLRNPAIAVTAATIAGVLAGHLRYTSERYWAGLPGRGRWLVIPGLLLVAAGLFACGFRRTRETNALAAAERHPASSPAAFSALLAASRIEPQNPETFRRLGDHRRAEANNRPAQAENLRREAIDWYLRSLAANRFDPLVHLRIGEVWHRLGKGRDNEVWFRNALQLDPNNPFVRAQMGWHYFDLNELAEARRWFEESLRLKPADTSMATGYLDLIRMRSSPGRRE